MTTTLNAHGLSVSLPTGWEGRITKLSPVDPLSASAHAASPSIGVEVTRPFLHLTNMAMPAEVDSFGGGIVEHLGTANVLIALIEYSSECLGTALFARSGLPRSLSARSFDRRALQRIIPRQAGSQSFFHESGRPFCLYVVLGSYARAGSMAHQVNRVLRTIKVSSAAAAR